jgi:hypothetical protein
MAEATSRIMQAGAYDQPDPPGARSGRNKKMSSARSVPVAGDDSPNEPGQDEAEEVHELDTLA